MDFSRWAEGKAVPQKMQAGERPLPAWKRVCLMASLVGGFIFILLGTLLFTLKEPMIVAGFLIDLPMLIIMMIVVAAGSALFLALSLPET